MRTMLIAFAGHQFNVRSDADEPHDIVALDAFRAELDRLTKVADRGSFTLATDEAGARRWHRDHFAAAALTGLLFGRDDLVETRLAASIARDAYVIADAMLAERDKTKPDAP